MTNHSNRGRILIRPLDNAHARYHYKVLSQSAPKGWQPKALIDDGLLIHNPRKGNFAVWQGFTLKSIDQRKALAALNE